MLNKTLPANFLALCYKICRQFIRFLITMKKYIFLICIVLSSCSQKLRNDSVVTLIKQDSLRLSVDEHINPYAVGIEYIDNGNNEDVLYILDGNNHLLSYDYQKRELIKKIVLAKNGNNGVGIANGFKVISQDSIIVTSKFYQKFFIINPEGEVISSFSFKNDSLFTSYTCSNIKRRIIICDHILTLPQNLMGNWNNISEEYFKNYTTTIDYNLESNEITKSGMKLPYKYPNLNSPGYSFASFQGQIVYSFAAKDSIFVVKDKIIIPFDTKTSNIERLIGSKRENDTSVENILRNKIESGEYVFLLPDPYRKVLYRFYRIGLKNLKKNENLMDLNSYPPSFGIQVINKEFKVIADVKFPERIYFFTNSFVTKNGLYLCSNYPFNPDFDVDYFTFDRFILKKEE